MSDKSRITDAVTELILAVWTVAKLHRGLVKPDVRVTAASDKLARVLAESYEDVSTLAASNHVAAYVEGLDREALVYKSAPELRSFLTEQSDTMLESMDCIAAFCEEKKERRLMFEAGELDVGQDSDSGVSTPTTTAFDMLGFGDSVETVNCKTGEGACFYLACSAMGVSVEPGTRRVADMSARALAAAASKSKFKVMAYVYGKSHPLNHLQAVDSVAANYKGTVVPKSGSDSAVSSYVLVVTSAQQFFSVNNEFYSSFFYADVVSDGFGNDLHADAHVPEPVAPIGAPRAESVAGGDGAATPLGRSGQSLGGLPSTQFFDATSAAAPGGLGESVPKGRFDGYGGIGGRFNAPKPESVMDEEVVSGSANLTSGVTRSKRRNISAKSSGALGLPVSKGYKTSNRIMFNNVSEMFLDTISREYAQEIVEDLFERWHVPLDQPEAVKYAEDLLFLFLIATTASNKADYAREFYIPVRPVMVEGERVDELPVSFAVLSGLLMSVYNKTRRQFSRALADDQRSFLRHDDNVYLLPMLATRAGCETQLAYLAFDGSTHCSNMTTREVSFTKNLEGRNLFERDDVVAQGAGERLMSGMSTGVRSVSAR